MPLLLYSTFNIIPSKIGTLCIAWGGMWSGAQRAGNAFICGLSTLHHPSIHSNPWRSFGSGIFILPTKPEVNDKNDITMEETCKVGAQSVVWWVGFSNPSGWCANGALRCTCILRWIVGGDGLLLYEIFTSDVFCNPSPPQCKLEILNCNHEEW